MCGGAACPDGGDEPLLVPVGGTQAPDDPTMPSETGECPSSDQLTTCDVDNEGLCVYEPPGAELRIPCVVLCSALSLECEGTSINLGRACEIAEYHDDCWMVGARFGCVCAL